MPRYRRCREQGCHGMALHPNHYCNKHIEKEQDYLDSRQKWVNKNKSNYQKKYNTINRYRSEQKIEQTKFYRSKQWQTIRSFVLERDHYLCQYCKLVGRVKQGNIGEHIVPIEFEPSLIDDDSNICCSCRDCHKIKTDWEREYYFERDGSKKNVAMIKNILDLPCFKIIPPA